MSVVVPFVVVPLFVVVRVFVAIPGSLLVVAPLFVIIPFVVGPVFVVVVVVFVVNPGPLRCDSMGSFGGSYIILRSSNSTENSRSLLRALEACRELTPLPPSRLVEAPSARKKKI